MRIARSTVDAAGEEEIFCGCKCGSRGGIYSEEVVERVSRPPRDQTLRSVSDDPLTAEMGG